MHSSRRHLNDGIFDRHTFDEIDIDFLFIDGDHSYEGVKKDFEMYSPFVRKGGLIVFHDTNDSQKHRDRNVYVSKFWSELMQNMNSKNIITYQNRQYRVNEFNAHEDWAGIGVLITK